MTTQRKLTLAAGMLVLGMLSIPVVRRFSANASESEVHKSANLGASGLKDEGGSSRKSSAGAWKLPFRLKPRLTPEQAAILADGRVGAYLREHPEQDDLLVAWAAADPEAAGAWLASVGNVEVNDVG